MARRGVSRRRTVAAPPRHAVAQWEPLPCGKTIKRKTSHYGELTIPYVLALNVDDFSFDDEDVTNAMFGDETYTFNFDTDEVFPRRKPNGVWYGPKGYENKRMSGVCLFRYLRPDRIHLVEPVLWHHPYANNPLSPDLWSLQQQILNKQFGQHELHDGQSVVELLGIDIKRMPK